MNAPLQRKLTTVLAADAAGYSQRMEEDEVATLTALRACRDVFKKFIARHAGRVANTAGDGLIAEFPSVVEAVQCAIEVQRELAALPQEPTQLQFRIGVHLGDVIVDGDDLLGEGVNLAARLQSMAEPGGILISQQVFDQVRSKLTVGFDYLGEKRPKNYTEEVPIYRVSGEPRGKGPVVRPALDRVLPQTSVSVPEAPPSLRAAFARHARVPGFIIAGLFVIDVITGPPVWVQWPALAFLAFAAFRALKDVDRPGRDLFVARLWVVAIALLFINIFSGSGPFWSFWPLLGVAILSFIRRRRRRVQGGT